MSIIHYRSLWDTSTNINNHFSLLDLFFIFSPVCNNFLMKITNKSKVILVKFFWVISVNKSFLDLEINLQENKHLLPIIYLFIWGSRELLVLVTSCMASILTFLILSLRSGLSRALPTPSRRSRNIATWRLSSTKAWAW